MNLLKVLRVCDKITLRDGTVGMYVGSMNTQHFGMEHVILFLDGGYELLKYYESNGQVDLEDDDGFGEDNPRNWDIIKVERCDRDYDIMEDFMKRDFSDWEVIWKSAEEYMLSSSIKLEAFIGTKYIGDFNIDWCKSNK